MEEFLQKQMFDKLRNEQYYPAKVADKEASANLAEATYADMIIFKEFK
ncbi:MAG: hypothetical protein R2788_23790 [Saprospiraceae bacterium]